MAARPAAVLLVLEYDGGRYHGSQLQSNGPTIQGELEKAVESLTGEAARVRLASRTDAGVHALGQVASLEKAGKLPLKRIIDGLNYYLPPDIAVKEAYRLKKDIDVRHQAVSRQYLYKIINSQTPSPLSRRYTQNFRQELDIGKMNRAASLLIGIRDFASFASGLEAKGKSTVREVTQAEFKREGQSVTFHIQANAFLPHQIRNTIGALLKVGTGKMTLQEFKAIMETRKVGLAGPAAPPQGLYLESVKYKEEFLTES